MSGRRPAAPRRTAMQTRRALVRGEGPTADPNAVRRADGVKGRQETLLTGVLALAAGFLALSISATRGYLLLYGDAVAHLGIARRIVDTNSPGLAQLGGVWLPLPHLLMLPFIGRMAWWQSGMAGAWPSLVCYALAVMGLYRLARRLVPPRWALFATAFFGLNANLLYLSGTAMTEPLFLALLIWIVLLTMEFVEAVEESASRGLKPESSRDANVRAEARTYLRSNDASEDRTSPRIDNTSQARTYLRSNDASEDRTSRRSNDASEVRTLSGSDDTGAVRLKRGRALRRVTGHMLLLGFLILAATLTRYDGWVLGAAVWCVVAWQLWKSPAVGRHVLSGFAVFTLFAVAGPAFWFSYNHVFGHDWLDFMRGPYSAREIDRKTSPPGSHKYWGWHNPAWSLMLYARTAQVDAAAWETGWLVAVAALWGSWKAWGSGVSRSSLLLWLPLPFYVYSISYGSVPIFIPQLYPHAYYNSRYGMEMLPALAVFTACALRLLVKRAGRAQPLVERLAQPVAMLLVVLNTIAMLYAVPLVLREAMVNSRGRVALEEPMGHQLAMLRQGATILMENSDHVGALQAAGIPLRQTIGPSDYYRWRDALTDPAGHANYAVSIGDDAVAQAVKAHPEGLTPLSIVCSASQSGAKQCVRFYQSDRFRSGH